MLSIKNLNITVFFLFLSIVTHGYNTQILLKNDQRQSHQKKCITNPNLNKVNLLDSKDNLFYRKNRSIGLEVTILQPAVKITKPLFVSIKKETTPICCSDLFFKLTSNPKRGPPLV